MQFINSEPILNTGVPDEVRFGRCPACGFIAADAYDYDCQGNEVFRCERRTCGVIFAQDKEGAYALVNGAGF